jgi:hypothetical protein
MSRVADSVLVDVICAVVAQRSRVACCSSSAAADPGCGMQAAHSSSIRGSCGSAKDEDVFVSDDPDGEPAGPGFADLIELEEGGAGNQPVMA